MEQHEEIGKRIREIASKGGIPKMFNADVVSVQGDTCTVTLSGMRLTGVKLSSYDGAESGMVMKPKAGSTVTVLDTTGEKRDMYCIKCSEIDGMSLSVGTVSLSDVIADLMDTLSQAVITTPAGAGSFAPDVVTKIGQLKTKFKTLFYGTE